jgi:hypothetical protein
MLILSFDGVISGHVCRLAVESAISPQWEIQKPITSTEWYLLVIVIITLCPPTQLTGGHYTVHNYKKSVNRHKQTETF